VTATNETRTFAFVDGAAHAEWRLVVVRKNGVSAGYGFTDEAAARAGAVAYMSLDDTRCVWVEPVERRKQAA
jgi:hypothetical protein